jgi:hypothetical protein
MHGSATRDAYRPRGRRTWLRRAGPLTAALAMVGLLASACDGGGSSDPGVASGGSGSSTTTAPSSSAGGAAQASGLAYSQCMRSHGITNFPDPSSSGGINISAGSGVDPNSPQYQAATKACESVAPGGGTAAQQQQTYTADLKYAQCMQARGQEVPDPKAPGSGPSSQRNSSGNGNASSGAINPNSPQFIAANKACQHYLPAGASGPSTNSSGS